MIWKSVFIMTIFDLIIITITLILFWNYYQNRQLHKKLKIQKGISFILCGFIVMAVLYFVDLLTMHLFPRFMPMKKSMEIMTNLHLNYNWIISAVGFSFLFAGILYLNKVLFPRIIYYQNQLEKETITDDLTGVLNRRGFFNMAKKQCEIARRNNLYLYFLFLDIDGMKVINDKYGHIEGDMALKNTSLILSETFRASDIISRIGGDEFVVMSMESPEISIELLSIRLEKNLAAFNSDANKPYNLSFSLGLNAFYPEAPCKIDELLSKADKMMYEKKKNNRS